MSKLKRYLDPFTNQSTGFEEEPNPEIELAFLLENVQPGDQRITAVLVERYASELYQFIGAVFEIQRGVRATEQEILETLQLTFTTAIYEVERFWGKDKVRNWLFSLALHQIRKMRPREVFPISSHLSGITTKSRASDDIDSDNNDKDEYWQYFVNLPANIRMLVVMRYLHQLSVMDIAQILSSNPQRISSELIKFRDKLFNSNQLGLQLTEKSHNQFRLQINQIYDGLLVRDFESKAAFKIHLENCPECQAYADQLDRLEEKFSKLLRQFWPLHEFAQIERDRIIGDIKATKIQTPRLKKFLRPLWKGAWVGFVVLLVSALGWGLIQLSNTDDTVLRSPTTTPPQLPNPIEIQSYSISLPDSEITEPESFIYLQPAASGNGRFIAFTIQEFFNQENQHQKSSDIFIYNREDRTLERVHFTASGFESFIWDYAPWTSVPEDPNKPTPVDPSDAITNNIPSDTSTVFFYDRENDQRIRIDLVHDDNPREISNFYPAVSSNGRYLVFWSNAAYLIPGGSPTCAGSSSPSNCLDVFIIDRQTAEIQVVPVGREIKLLEKNAHLSVSDDGTLIALSLIITDKIASRINLDNTTEAYIYNISADYYIPVNISDNRIVGNGPSILPRLSADGRYVAFASLADNLVPDDSNQEADIFVRDLHSGKTEMVALTSNVQRENNQTDSSDRYYGFWMDTINLSSNGRYITILSTLENLTHHYRLGCSPSPEGYCLSIFVHDRQTGETDQTNTYQLEDHDRVIDISDDGRIVTNFEYYTYCPTVIQSQVCAEVWQQDRYRLSENIPRYGYYASDYSRWIHDDLFDGLPGAANAFSLSPDSEILAYGTKEDTVHLWRLSDRVRIASLSGNSVSSIYSLDFSPDGEYLAAGSSDGTVNIWQLTNSNEVYSLTDHPGRVIDCAFTPLGDHLIVGTPQQLWIWQKQDQSFVRIAVLDYPGNFVNNFALSPDGQWLAIAGEDRTVWIQHLSTQQVVHRLAGHEQEISNVVFSPDGKYLASGDKQGKINIWKLDWESEETLKATYRKTLIQPGWVTHLDFSADGNILASSSFTGLLRLWRLPNGELLETPPAGRFDFMPNGVFLFDGRILVAGSSSGLIHVWRGPENISTPSFFFRSEMDELDYIPTSQVDPAGDVENLHASNLPLEDLYVNIYQAGGTGLFNIQVPLYIPPGMTFIGARIGPAGIIVFQYEILDSSQQHPIAQIFISQHTELPPFLIGKNAVIERSKVEGRDAEYVEGDWVPSLEDEGLGTRANITYQWIWDQTATARRLRWKEGSVIFAIHLKSYHDDPSESMILTHDDLITIAESMSVISKVSD
jgi:WD40 repeat protein/DNA-directed RNA polymerase specialized sigma24 family protein